MTRHILRLATVTAILAVGLYACERSGPVSADIESAAPRTVVLNGVELLTAPGGRGLRPAAAVRVDAVTGGVVRSADATLTVPAGAVGGPTRITMSSASGGVDAYTFGPDGLVFERPATLTVAIDPARLAAAGIDPADLRMAGASDGAEDWTVVGGSYDPASGTVSVSVHHFSRYALCIL